MGTFKKCPWCGGEKPPLENRFENDKGTVIERICADCEKVLAAYLEEDSQFFPTMRNF